ncbi:MAG: hypothetical protein HWN81_00220 [Candidatus Lokiarchaeota archaeon]|nr:hypothetical protein [Candidatus Lokiarchaeota archaeon]
MLKILKDRIQGKAPKGAKRSSKWRKVRKQFLKDNPKCAVCSSVTSLEVHHCIPFHLAPDLELENDNLITLCENKKYGVNCHLLIGHLGNYKRANMQVKIDAITWNMKIKH